MTPRRGYLEIFGASLAAILLEIAYTRIFSFKVYYYFTYLIIGIALLGLGAGGVLVAVSRRLREADPQRLIAAVTAAGAASVLAGYLIVAPTQLNVANLGNEPLEALTLFGMGVLITVPFVAVGIVVSTILAAEPASVGPLYATDLLGAGLGCTCAITLLEALDPPGVIMLSGALLAAAGLRAASGSRSLTAVSITATLALVVATAGAGRLPDPVVDRLKGYEDFRRANMVRHTRYSPVFRVDVAEHPMQLGELFLVFHDGTPGSSMWRLSDRKAGLPHLPKSSRRLPFEVIEERRPRVLIIGSAGGHEVVASLSFGAESITAVELNAATLSLLTGEYAEITGRLHEDPRVKFVNADGRWFLEQSKENYDIIWFVAPDSYAAMNASTSGAFVLAESYLYTVEMMKAALNHLEPGGVVCAQFGEYDYERKPNRTLRFIATARQAYYEEKIPDFKKRVLIATGPGLPPIVEGTIVLSRRELTNEQIDRFLQQVRRMEGGFVRFFPGIVFNESIIHRALMPPTDTVAAWYRSYPYLIEPVRDESPFFWHFARFSDALFQPAQEPSVDFEDAIGERMLFYLLALAVVLGALFALVPLRAVRGLWTGLPHKGAAAVYFASLGLGFMFIEVALIQKLTLLLGYPTRSLSVTLFSLLVSTGVGSFLSSRYTASWERALGTLLSALVMLVSLWLLVMPRLVDYFVAAPLAARVAVAIATTAPLGVCLGGFLPVGMSAVAHASPHPQQYVAWAWAINAFASVVGSILSAIFAMIVGFKFLIIGAPIIYATGALALLKLGAPPASESGEPEPLVEQR